MSGSTADPAGGPVLFVGGVWGSGTTLLDLLLGELPGLVAVGELRQLWRSGVLEDRRCGCGAPFGTCPFWREVGRLAFGGWRPEHARQMAHLQRSLDAIGQGARHVVLRTPSPRVRPLLASLERVLGAVRTVSGAEVVVDSSKAPGHAVALRACAGQRVRLIHMVRDPRAVVFSQQRRAEVARARGEEPGAVVRRWALRWNAYNAMLPMVFPRAERVLTLRYEDLAERPRPMLERTAGAAGLGLPPDAFAFVGEGAATLGAQHTVYGNPIRFSVGEVEIAPDDEWNRAMSAADRRAVTRITLPLLRRYGYRT